MHVVSEAISKWNPSIVATLEEQNLAGWPLLRGSFVHKLIIWDLGSWSLYRGGLYSGVAIKRGSTVIIRITDTSWSLSIEHSICIIIQIIHTSSSHGSPNGEVQSKPSVTGISGHSVQIIARCVVWSVSDDSIGNGRYRGTLNGCMVIINSLIIVCCEQAAISNTVELLYIAATLGGKMLGVI